MNRKSFKDTGTVSTSGHTLTFLANSGTRMVNGLTVDLDTLRIPLADGSLKLLNEVKDTDRITVPLLTDHIPSIEGQAGTVTQVWRDSTGMMAKAKLSDVEAGQRVQQLAKDEALTNSFSITIDFCDEPDEDGVIHNGELVEISVVYRGADSKASFRSLNSRESNTMNQINLDMTGINKQITSFKLTDDEASKLTTAVKEALQTAVDTIVKAVTEDSDPAKDEGGEEPEPPVDNTIQNSKDTTMPVIINKPGTLASGKTKPDIVRIKNTRDTYLDSKKAFNDYAEFLFAHPVSGGKGEATAITKQWSEHASKELADSASFGIDSTDVDLLIPKSVVTKIEDVFNTRGSGLWNLLNHTGLDVPMTLGVNEVGLDDEGGRAHGYPVSAYGTNKVDEKISLKTRSLSTDYVYKMISLNKGDIRRTPQPSQLLTYVLSELPNRIIHTIERSVVLNDADSDWKDMAMFRSVVQDSKETETDAGTKTIPGNEFALTYTQKATESALEAFMRASAKVRASGAKVLITTPETLLNLQLSKDSQGDFMFPFGGSVANVTSALGVSQIITPDWYLDRDSANAAGVIMVPSAYDVDGDTTIEAFSNFALRTNTMEYLQEVWTGGGLTTVKSASVVKLISQS